MTSTVDSTITAFVRGLGLPRAGEHALTELPSDAVIADHLEVLRRLGSGAKGVVYLARDTRLRRVVAVKLVLAEGDVAASRAEREAHAMARLAHPNVLAVHEVGRWSEFVYITMEHVDGGTLRRWQSLPERDWREIVAAYLQAARGLHAAHLAGLTHRDFKPDNVLIGRELADGATIGRVRVGDFGLAHRDGEAAERIAGTRSYMAPEQVLERVDGARADQFSFGVSLYEALCGSLPYAVPESWSATAADLRPPPRALPQWLRSVLLRSIALDPVARFDDLGALADALERGLGRAGRRRAFGILATAVATTATAGLVIGAWLQSPSVVIDCTDGALETVWNGARAQRIGEMLGRTGSPIAGRTHAELVQRVGDWTQRWREQRMQGCEAARDGVQSPQLFDRRNACLDRALAELDATLTGLASVDREGLARAGDLLSELPALAHCSDPLRLLSAVAVPDPPELRDAVERARARLDAARVATAIGRTPEAAASARQVRDSEAAARYPPLHAEASLALGIALMESYEYADAEAALEAAFEDALASGYDDVVSEAAEQLVCNAASIDDGTERARQWADIAEAAATRLGLPEADRASLRYCRASMHIEAGEHALAAGLLREAIALREQTPAQWSFETGILHDLLGSTLTSQSHYEDARGEHELAYRMITDARGPIHPRALEARSHLGSALRQLQRPDDALAIHLESLERIIEVHGPEGAASLVAYNDVGLALVALAATPLGTAYFERGVAIARRHPTQGRIALALFQNLARHVARTGDGERVLSLAREALEVAEGAWGRSHPRAASAHAGLASALNEAERPEEALAHYQMALAIYDAALGEDSFESGGVHLNMLSEGLEHLVDFDQHIRAAERAAIASGNDELMGGVCESRAHYLRVFGDYATARVFQRRAVSLTSGRSPSRLRGALMTLGQDEVDAGDPLAGMVALERARAIAVTQGDEHNVANCDSMLAAANWALGNRQRGIELMRHAIAEYRRLGASSFERAARVWLAHPNAKVIDLE